MSIGKATKKATAKKTVKKVDNVYWVIQVRKYVTWKVHSLYTTYVAALRTSRTWDVPARNVKIERVELVA